MKRYVVYFTIWFLIALTAILFYLCSQGWKWDWSTGWEAIGALSTWLLAGGIGAAFRQIQESRKSTNAQIAIGLSQKLRDEEAVELLQKIYELEPERITSLPNSNKKEDQELENKIIQVVDNLELLGALVAQGIVNEDMAIIVYGGPTSLKCWYKLNEYITRLRSTRHSLCSKYLEDFAARTWERSHHEHQKIYFYRAKGEEIIDLIEFFDKQPGLRPKRYKK